MSRDKQMFNDLIEIFDEEYGKRNLITPQNTAEKLTAKGYRKSTEVAEEIFADLSKFIVTKVIDHGTITYDVTDKYIEVQKKYGVYDIMSKKTKQRMAALRDIAKLKKKYIGEDTNVTTKTEGK